MAVNFIKFNDFQKKIYKGYGVLTNKVTESEKEGIKHHLIDFLELDKQYTVQDFEIDALEKVINHFIKRYNKRMNNKNEKYTLKREKAHSLSNESRELKSDSESKKIDHIYNFAPTQNAPSIATKASSDKYDGFTNDQLMKRLEEIDPVMSQRWHPNDRRKIIRSIEIFDETGKPHSQWIHESQKISENNENQRSMLMKNIVNFIF
ncbi:tRNA dimethylallyltransferase, mitochondrial [Smittium culicis]|uniref:tRNA dimethylallyltransferase, mitochondrial n=1 Tax=Smittium culicis TaxID=133412 RepID=A0A1R1YF86_9FUNG|nr:tRNA dimethylallyltransferase, mitochondrial [Smittium culicis]